MDNPSNRDLSISETYRHNLLTFQEIKTRNPSMVECLRLAREAAHHDLPIMILGDNGTGKNLLAQAIHTAGQRAGKPFVSVNCAALVGPLLESELFGHEKGAFTDARRIHRGKFEIAEAGTLLLDEIGDLSLAAQAKILRAVEYRQFERVGGEETLETKARIITATNKDLRALVRQGEFRQDLFYRLRGFTIKLPALRDRQEDLRSLVEEFIEEGNRRYGRDILGLTKACFELIRRYPWPGNIRELRSVIATALIAEEGPRLTPSNTAFADLIDDLDSPPGDLLTQTEEVVYTMEEMEKRHIETTLARARWNKMQAAKLLGISRPTLDRKISKYRIQMET